MFSVMLNVAMREGAFWDNNMHKEQCIGPGHGASPWWFPVCFSGSVYQQIHYCKQFGDGQVLGQGPSLNEWRHLVDKQSSSPCLPCCQELAEFQAKSNPTSGFWERDQAWTRRPRWCECDCTDTKCGDLSVVCFLSPVCYAQFRSVDVSLQSPFQHTTDLEMTTLRISQWLFVEGRRTKLKDQANMHKVFRHCFAKSHRGQLFSWRQVREETVFLFFFFFVVEYFIFWKEEIIMA